MDTTSFNPWIDGSMILVFFGATVFIGSYFHKWIKSPEDFAVAGRQLTPFILAATLAATNINLYNFQGYVAYAYREGISIVWHEWTGLMALAFAGLFILPIFRRLRLSTIPEFAGRRYSPKLRMLIAFFWTMRFALWLGTVLYLAALVGTKVSGLPDAGWPYHSFVIIFGLMTIVFTMAGGMWAVALTDILQFVFLLGGALVMIPLIMSAVGYWGGMQETLQGMGREQLLHFVPVEGAWNWKGLIGISLLGLQWASTDQAMVQRAFGAKTIKGVAQGMVWAGLIMVAFAFIIPMPGIAYAIGVMTGEYPALLEQDNVLPQLLVGSGLVPVGVLGLILCGLLASQISTLDAGLNSAATVFTQDLWMLLKRTKPTPRQQVFVLRMMTVLIGVIMIGTSYWAKYSSSAVDFYITVIAVVDLPLFIVVVVYGLLWKRATPAGAIAGYVVGIAFGLMVELRSILPDVAQTFVNGVYRLYSYLPVLGDGVTTETARNWDTAIIGMIVTAIVVPVVSLMTRQTRQKEVEEIWSHRRVSGEELETGEIYHIWPATTPGRVFLIMMFVGLAGFIVGGLLGKYPAREGYGLSKLEMIRFEQSALLLGDDALPVGVSAETRRSLLSDLMEFGKVEADLPEAERAARADALAERMRTTMQAYVDSTAGNMSLPLSDRVQLTAEFSERVGAARAGHVPLKDHRYAGWVAVISMLVYFAGAILRMRYD